MTRRSTPVLVLVTLVAGALAAAPAFARPAGSATLLIRHQTAHCHAWSLNGGPFKAAQNVKLGVGSTLTVIDQDVMSHRLVKVSGPSVKLSNGMAMPMTGKASPMPGMMGHVGARTTARFTHPGVYRFRTHTGEDYFPGVRTTGDDNVLTLTVTVS